MLMNKMLMNVTEILLVIFAIFLFSYYFSIFFKSILVICQEKFKIVFDMFFLKKGALHRRSLIIFLKNERYSDSVFNSASSFSPVYSWFLTSKPKTSRTNLRDVSASALLC